MKRSRSLGFVVALLAAAFAFVAPLAVTSCAGTEDGGGQPAPPPSLAPESSVVDAMGAGDVEDGGCDPSDTNCVSVPISCDDVQWCPSPTGVSSFYALTKVWGTAKNDVWVVGSGGTIIHWDGATWTPSKAPPSPTEIKNTFFAVGGSGPSDVWIVSSSQAIFRNTGGGWVRQTPLLNNGFYELPIYAMWLDQTGALRLGTGYYNYFGEDFVFYSGNQFTKKTDHGGPDAGIEWGLDSSGETARVLGYYGTADDLWYIADNSGTKSWERALTVHGVRASAAEELTWTKVESNSLVRLSAIWGSSANDIWAVGEQGAMRRMRPGRTSWEVVPSVTKESLRALWGTSATDIWAAGENGTILHYDGTTWTPDQAAFSVGKNKPHLTGIWGSGPDDVWIVGGAVALHYEGKKRGAE